MDRTKPQQQNSKPRKSRPPHAGAGTKRTPTIAAERGIYCNRTLNMRSIKAVGYDMDYTLIHYRVEEWEKRTYEYIKQHFLDIGWPVKDLTFDPTMVCRGLIIDAEQGNLIKANRFGFVKRAQHGTKAIDHETHRKIYSRTVIDMSEPRWVFLNTLFSLSEGCMYAQLVDLLDQRKIPAIVGYADLYWKVRHAVDYAHAEGRLKAEIISDPDRFVDLDPDVPLALLDQKHAGKKIMLITNSDYQYSVPMMSYAFDRFLPKGMTWRQLFDVVIVSSRKPDFFTTENPFFRVATDDGLLAPIVGELVQGQPYYGGSARQLERHLKLSGDEILYVGDHMFGDVRVTKNVLRWRTALILRELEDEIRVTQSFSEQERRLAELMEKKETLEAQSFQARLDLQRVREKYSLGGKPHDEEALSKRVAETRLQLDALDKEIGPLAKTSSELYNRTWGLLMRAGSDMSRLAFQMERYADIYTSRVSNFLHATPFVYLRAPRSTMPHDLVLRTPRNFSEAGNGNSND